jgi:lipopolysaccharide/colanic/teichoic acid biosynthesis glycosyltransferase
MAPTPLPENYSIDAPTAVTATLEVIQRDGWPAVEAVDPSKPLVLRPQANWYTAAKPVFDWVLAALLLIPALPIIALCWLGVRLTSHGAGFYVQSRLGRGGREYKMIKLRTMAQDAEAKNGGAKWSTKGDARITPFGKFLRKTHFDELPQLFNVLMCQMSLVGPRPERQEIIDKLELSKLVPGYDHRLSVKPGVTGIAQIQLPADSGINSVKHKVVYDLYYIENYGLWFDLRIMAATAFKAISVSPTWLRRLFFLPPRETVVEVLRLESSIPVQPSPQLEPVV